MSENRKKQWGDKKYAYRVKDVPGMNVIMGHLMPNRTDAEVYLNDKIDATELVKYLEKKNAEHPDYKTTVFHCAIVALARMVRERPKMNRFIQGRRMYERKEISLSFVCKRRFTDHAEEALMVLVPKDTDTINEVSKKIVGEVRETRKSEHSTGGVDQLMDTLAKLPRPLLMLVVRIVRWLDFWGMNPDFITNGDPNYTTILCSNLGSIKCPSVYHHLNNYGTNSIMVTIGTLHKEEMLMEDGHKEIRDVIDIGATLDERIADGFYFARSLKLVKYIFAHPEMLEQPLNVPSEFDYK
ncbi:MAG: 2-oxo acid dehydrogenase subunit E2 [Clostridiales bacterium]|nr:2-oxo acid dehydrogenase subunit E2 [Candidatus Blautia equi]